MMKTIITTKAPKKELNALLKSKATHLRMIGKGCYAKVYSKKTLDTVYKVGMVSGNEPYLAFVDEVLATKKENPHLPKIQNVTIIMGQGNQWDKAYFVVEMEKLQPLRFGDKQSKVVGELDWSLPARQLPAASKQAIIKNTAGKLRQAMLVANKARDKTHSLWDIHEGNFMLRKGVLVIIDPLWEGGVKMTYKIVAVCPYCGAVADKKFIGKLCMNCYHSIMKEQQ